MKRSASPSWEPLLVAYLSGGCDFTTLYSAARKPLVRIAARLAPIMPEDLREDVVQEFFIRLIENPPKYDPRQCSARILTYGLLRNAVRHVRATFALPGQKTRMPDSGNGQSNENLTIELTAQRTTSVKEISPEEIDQAPSPRWTADNNQAFVQAHELLAQMPQEVGTAAWMVYGLEFSIVEAAKMMGTSRFTVARSLKEARQLVGMELLVHEEQQARHRQSTAGDLVLESGSPLEIAS
jgi:RNA polymerase sigma factor (sigma-70 family)